MRTFAVSLLLFTLVASSSTAALRAQEKPAEGGDAKKEANAGDENEAVEKALAEDYRTESENDRPLAVVLAGIEEATNVVVDPAVPCLKTVERGMYQGTVKQVLNTVLAKVSDDLTYEVWRGVVYVTSKKNGNKVPPAAKLTKAAADVAGKKKITLDFEDAPLEDVVAALADRAGVPFEVAPKLERKIRLTVHARKVTVGAAIDIVCRLADLKVEADGDKNVIKPR